MKLSFALGAVATVIAVAVPTLAHRKEEALRNWHDLPQSQRELRAPTSQQLNTIFPNGARQVLEQSPQLILLSVNPGAEDYDSVVGSKTPAMFHGHMILGQTVIADPATKTALLASFYDGFVAPPDPRGLKQIGFGCFNPRHGIRATHNGKTVDLLICFGCRKFNGYLNNHQFAQFKNINDAPAKKFNEMLTAAGAPLAQK